MHFFRSVLIIAFLALICFAQLGIPILQDNSWITCRPYTATSYCPMSFCDCTSSYLLPRVTELNGQTVTLLSNHDAFMALDSAIYHSPCPFTELTQAGKKIMVQTQTAEYCGPIEFVPPALDGPILYTAPPPRKARDVPTETPAVTAAPIALSVLLERPYRD